MSNVSLTTGMRNNLVALQGINKLLSQTQERLSTGKKVNNAIDNPTSYFTAQAHTQRAADLSTKKDGMSEAIQAVKAANAGIEAITSLIESAKGVASSALSTSSTTDRSSYSTQFSTLLSQIDDLAKDSGYKGTNLLQSNDLTVNFNEDSSSSMTVSGFDSDSGGLNIDAAANSWAGDTDITASMTDLDNALNTLRSKSRTLSSNMSVITTRQDFTNNLVNILQTGADNLVLADMNEESANLLALQTQQSLGINSLSLSSQSAQSILRLF